MSKRRNYKLPPRGDKLTVEDSIVHGRRLCAVGDLTFVLEGKWPHPAQSPMPCCSEITFPLVHSEALKTDGLVRDRHTVLWSPAVLKSLLLFTLMASATGQTGGRGGWDRLPTSLFLPRTSFGKLRGRFGLEMTGVIKTSQGPPLSVLALTCVFSYY